LQCHEAGDHLGLLVGSFGHAMMAEKTKTLTQKMPKYFFFYKALKKHKIVPVDSGG
jgi:hypothetical protein